MAMRKPITSATIRRSMTGARSRAEGAGFESLINSACEYYRTNGIADIEKTPEPMKPLGGADTLAASLPAIPSRPSLTTRAFWPVAQP